MLSAGKSILLVDDNADDRFFVEQAWRKANIKNPLRTLEDGRHALDYLLGVGQYADRAHHPIPALLLLDIKMPGMTGFELLERLRRDERLRTLPVLILTASTAPSDVNEAYRLGANGFFIKPSSAQELVEMMAALKNCWLRFNEFPV